MQLYSLRMFIKVLSYGENRPNWTHGSCPTIHAEEDAMQKLPNNRKRRKRINLMVIRSNIGGTVGNSRPCSDCTDMLIRKLPSRGYVLDKIYYTSRGGILICEKFTHFVRDTEHIHFTKLYRGIY